MGVSGVQEGIQLLEESYLAIVWAFAEIVDLDRATAVIRSMHNAGQNPVHGARYLLPSHLICFACDLLHL
jgi:hypothetical protein